MEFYKKSLWNINIPSPYDSTSYNVMQIISSSCCTHVSSHLALITMILYSLDVMNDIYQYMNISVLLYLMLITQRFFFIEWMLCGIIVTLSMLYSCFWGFKVGLFFAIAWSTYFRLMSVNVSLVFFASLFFKNCRYGLPFQVRRMTQIDHTLLTFFKFTCRLIIL